MFFSVFAPLLSCRPVRLFDLLFACGLYGHYTPVKKKGKETPRSAEAPRTLDLARPKGPLARALGWLGTKIAQNNVFREMAKKVTKKWNTVKCLNFQEIVNYYGGLWKKHSRFKTLPEPLGAL